MALTRISNSNHLCCFLSRFGHCYVPCHAIDSIYWLWLIHFRWTSTLAVATAVHTECISQEDMRLIAMRMSSTNKTVRLCIFNKWNELKHKNIHIKNTSIGTLWSLKIRFPWWMFLNVNYITQNIDANHFFIPFFCYILVFLLRSCSNSPSFLVFYFRSNEI